MRGGYFVALYISQWISTTTPNRFPCFTPAMLCQWFLLDANLDLCILPFKEVIPCSGELVRNHIAEVHEIFQAFFKSLYRCCAFCSQLGITLCAQFLSKLKSIFATMNLSATTWYWITRLNGLLLRACTAVVSLPELQALAVLRFKWCCTDHMFVFGYSWVLLKGVVWSSRRIQRWG